ncbi:MAG: S8 family serine peptidase [Chloroflexota bacterium]|nr:S8 family serine peptidase [Chloroflexota bacterium]
MPAVRFGGRDGQRLELEDRGDLVVIRTKRRGARHDQSPLSSRSRSAQRTLEPLFGFPSAGVGVYKAPEGESAALSSVIDEDDAVEFAGRGLRDAWGAPIVYTENLFVKFADTAASARCEEILRQHGLSVKRSVKYAANAYFAQAPQRTGRDVFTIAERLFEHDEIELCHPEIVREKSVNGAFAQQWHLQEAEIGGRIIAQHAHVVSAWEITQGDGVIVAVIDDGVDVDHEEWASGGKVVAPRSVSIPRGGDARPSDGDNHGTAVSGVAVADGRHGAAGVAPKARLMPIRNASALGSFDEAEAFVWAADNGAAVINCSWGPTDGDWFDDAHPGHQEIVPLPDSARLAIDYAVTNGRDGLGCVIVWAAGNGNESVDNDGYASYEKVIAVAACNDVGTRSAYSDMGNAIWCAFPSNNFPTHGSETVMTKGIWTTDRTGNDGYNSGSESFGDAGGNYTDSFGGTSSAAPGVAGVAALVIAANPALRWEQVKDILKRCCDRIDDRSGEYDANGHSTSYGFGRVNARAAVELAQAS